MRMLALADGLRRLGFAVTFFARERDGDLAERVREAGFARVVLGSADATWLGADSADDAACTARSIEAAGGADVMIVDNYAVDAAWERTVRGAVRSVVVVDDLADRSHACELLIDQNLGSSLRYAELVPAETRLLLGPRYALLREEFRDADSRPSDGNVKSILIFMGGYDASNQTTRALRALGGVATRYSIEVVLPPQAPHAPAVREQCERIGVRYLGQTGTMARLLERTDFVVGAGGTALWERAWMGVPSASICVADNQRAVTRAADAAGVTCLVGDAELLTDDEIERALLRLLDAPEALVEMSAKARAVSGADVAAFGTDTVAAAVLEAAT